jgi:polyphosphate glucokinase
VTGVLGIDIGGSGIKGAVVDTATGELLSDRHRIETPQPSTPDAVAEVVAELVAHHGYEGPVGCTFPAVVRRGVVQTAANVDESWIGTDADALFTERLGMPVTMLNDADAAGLAEMRFGAGRDRDGVVLLLTFGTGIGSGLIVDGRLVPNTELGHLQLDGVDAEDRAASRWREEEDLSWEEWAGRVNRYLQHVERVLPIDLFIIGGGVSRRADKFFPHLDLRTPFVAAHLRNNAGIVGAAVAAAVTPSVAG